MSFAIMRRFISAIACYGFILQSIFAGAASAAMVHGAIDGVLCITSTDGSPPGHDRFPDPADHSACCVAFCCSFAASAAILADGALPQAVAHDADASLIAMVTQAVGVWPSERPRSSRAPPAGMD